MKAGNLDMNCRRWVGAGSSFFFRLARGLQRWVSRKIGVLEMKRVVSTDGDLWRMRRTS